MTGEASALDVNDERSREAARRREEESMSLESSEERRERKGRESSEDGCWKRGRRRGGEPF